MRFYFPSLLAMVLTPFTTSNIFPADSETPKPLTFHVPKGWKPVNPAPLPFARFQIGEKDQIAAVVVAELPGDGGGLAANVNRWRTQLKLEQLSNKDVLQSLKTIKVDGIVAHFLDISGRESSDKAGQRILAVMLHRDKHTWVFRMSGPASLVEKQKAAFEGFVKSVRFKK